MQYDAEGKSELKNTFITTSPFVGKRFLKRSFALDLTAGLDLAFCLSSHEKGKAVIIVNNIEYGESTVSNDVQKPGLDIRPRLQAKLGYEKFGFLIGYSLGLTNYHLIEDHTSDKAYSGFLRLGLSYRIR
jgi:hypothetical protein